MPSDNPLLALVGETLGADPSVPSVAVTTYALPEVVFDDYGERQFKVPDAILADMTAALLLYAANAAKFYMRGSAKWEHKGQPRYKMEVWGPWDNKDDPHVWLDAKMGQRQGRTRKLGGVEGYRHDGGSAGIYMDPDATLEVLTGAEVLASYMPNFTELLNARLEQDRGIIQDQARLLTNRRDEVRDLRAQLDKVLAA